MSLVLITGAAGLVGSAAARYFSDKGWTVIGIDKDLRQDFFGVKASTRSMRQELISKVKNYHHYDLDIRDQRELEKIFMQYQGSIQLIIHAAAQPSHDWAAKEPMIDFQINAQSTVQLLELTRKHCPEAVFIFISTNKVYGDTPNRLPLIEQSTRWELDTSHPFAAKGIDESMSVDQNMHSLFGCSKLSADTYVQEYGRYFRLRTVCFRCGCITGSGHAVAEQHGFLAYLMDCVIKKRVYTIYGYKGKQVRDNIHAKDLVSAFEQYFLKPNYGEIYNLGGGRHSNCSVIEAINLCEKISGNKMEVIYKEEPRQGDHIWWISNNSKFQKHYPSWQQQYDLKVILADIHKGIISKND